MHMEVSGSLTSLLSSLLDIRPPRVCGAVDSVVLLVEINMCVLASRLPSCEDITVATRMG